MTTPTIIVLVGITGDLSRRKLLPAIEGLREKGMLPEQFKLVGVTRRDDPELFKMDLDNADDYLRLKDHLENIEKEWGSKAQRLFYLSVAPTVSLPIIEHLGKSGLAAVPNTKIMLEKPFGLDQESAQQFIETIDSVFSEDQVYRIDHYLAKASVRALSEKSFDKKIIETIEVSAYEKIGIEGRGSFYEQTGALRDFIQSHLLEVAAMVIDPSDRVQALRDLRVAQPIASSVKRAQYKGYREAVHNADSTVETFVSVTLSSRNPSLAGAAITVKTGKGLDRKSTDIMIVYKDSASEVVSLSDSHNAYEHVFADAMNGDKTYFISKEEVLETWRILHPIQEAWKEHADDLRFYTEGASPQDLCREVFLDDKRIL